MIWLLLTLGYMFMCILTYTAMKKLGIFAIVEKYYVSEDTYNYVLTVFASVLWPIGWTTHIMIYCSNKLLSLVIKEVTDGDN